MRQRLLQMSEYLDVWAEFRLILSKTEKKLLKTPDYATAAKQLGRVSIKMQDLETPQDAAMCHLKMAHFNKILKKPIEERKDLLMAANLLRQCWVAHKQSLSRTCVSYPTEIIHLYSKAINIAEDQLKTKYLAGMMCIEAAGFCKDCEDFDVCLQFAEKATELLEREFFGRTEAWYLMLEMYFEQEEFNSFITTLDDLWIFVMKTKAKTFVGRYWLKECEMLTILCLKTEDFLTRRPTGRHRILLDMYGVLPHLFKDPRGQKVKLEEETALTMKECITFRKFLHCHYEYNTQEAVSILESKECKFMSKLVMRMARFVLFGQKI